MKYWILLKNARQGGLIDAFPRGGAREYLWSRGVSLADKYPKDASVKFSRNFPDARRIEDFQPNILRALIVSPRVRALLAELEVPDLEILPVAVRNHRDEIVGPDYAFVNPLGSQDAIDMERSSYEMGSLIKTQISDINRLVLSPQRIDPDAKLFRCRTYLNHFMIRDDVREAFERAKLTGYRLIEADGWDGLEL